MSAYPLPDIATLRLHDGDTITGPHPTVWQKIGHLIEYVIELEQRVERLERARGGTV